MICWATLCPATYHPATHSRDLCPNARTRRYRPNACKNLLAHRACSSLASVGLVSAGLGNTLGQNLGVLVLASSLTFSACRRLSAMRWRLCWRRWGVTSRWILGALV
ncbi:hypothetical protein M434DRAFT_281191 [Hypoxylon sp. CO27-5]|nr:hypothetical protein M434DRAFT_281191 [Hypoxylon sp. CO27-5]